MDCVLVLENLLNCSNPPLAELRLDYVKIAAYIDDLITLAYIFWSIQKNQSLLHLKKLNTWGL